MDIIALEFYRRVTFPKLSDMTSYYMEDTTILEFNRHKTFQVSDMTSYYIEDTTIQEFYSQVTVQVSGMTSYYTGDSLER